MSVPRSHTPLSKHTKISVQDTTSRDLFELFQECNSYFHGGQVLSITLAAQPVGGRGARLNGHPGYPLQIRTPVQHLGGLTPRAIQEDERRHSRRQPWARTQTFKERYITLRNQQIGHESTICEKCDELCRGCGAIPWKEARMRDTRTYQTGGISRLAIFVG